MTIDFKPFRLIPFRKEHEKPLIELITGCYLEYGQRIELDTLDNDLLQVEAVYPPPENTFQVLMDQEKLIGSVAVKRMKPGDLELKRVFLNPAYRGRGLGKKLSLWAHGWAGERGATLLHVWSDVLYETAHHLYRRLGARDTGQRRILGGVNDVAEYYFPWPIDDDEITCSKNES
ncbi:MAG: GNAT family N-acetyltransferase [Planctomycetes bacterium]|nr:GNAT family N-acetyltransferase [Planctomycetota bacterium]